MQLHSQPLVVKSKQFKAHLKIYIDNDKEILLCSPLIMGNPQTYLLQLLLKFYEFSFSYWNMRRLARSAENCI